MNAVRREVRRLTQLATPVALTQLSAMLLWTVDLLMVGRLGVTPLNAVSLGRLWVMGTTVVAMGLIFGVDPIASQAHGARDRKRLSRALLHVVAVALASSLPLASLFLMTERVLLAFGQDPATAALAHRYVVVQIPGLPFYLLFIALKQYLQARGIVRPAMWVSFAGNACNALINAVLIFGLLGAPALGAVGAGVATAATSVLLAGGLLLAIRRARLQRGSATVLDPRQVRRGELAEVLRLGAPVSLQLMFEYWAFAFATLLAGRLGAIDLAAHSIALNLASVSYMVPLGIASAAAARVGNRIGAEDKRGVLIAISTAFGVCVISMVAISAVLLGTRYYLSSLFGLSQPASARFLEVLLVVAGFQVFDGLQVVATGVLRGLGRTTAAASSGFVGYFVLGVPISAFLGAHDRLALVGIWLGLASGLMVMSLVLWAWISRISSRGSWAVLSVRAKRPRWNQ